MKFTAGQVVWFRKRGAWHSGRVRMVAGRRSPQNPMLGISAQGSDGIVHVFARRGSTVRKAQPRSR
jgi:hypothetical protein